MMKETKGNNVEVDFSHDGRDLSVDLNEDLIYSNKSAQNKIRELSPDNYDFLYEDGSKTIRVEISNGILAPLNVAPCGRGKIQDICDVANRLR